MGSSDLDDDARRIDAQLLSDLWIFRAVARFGSMTAAANRLGVTQSAVSQRLGRLEGRLGAVVFRRKSGKISLTNKGEDLLKSMNSVSSTLQNALERFDHLKKRALVVSCVPSLATEWLVPHLEAFYELHPQIELFIRAELMPASAERMEDEGIDLLITYQRTPPAGLQELAKVDELIIPVCSHSYRNEIAGSHPARIVRLYDDVPWLGTPTEFEWDTWVRARPEWSDVKIGERHFNLSNLAYHAALSGDGVAIGRTVLIHRLLSRGELVPATSLPAVGGASYFVMSPRMGPARGIRLFASWVATEMAKSQREALTMLESA